MYVYSRISFSFYGKMSSRTNSRTKNGVNHHQNDAIGSCGCCRAWLLRQFSLFEVIKTFHPSWFLNQCPDFDQLKMRIYILLLLIQWSHQEEVISVPGNEVNDFVIDSASHPCRENGVVASWCDSSINPKLECTIQPTLNMYSCKCDGDKAACPSECIEGSTMKMTTHGIQCTSIPQDEPNYILRNKDTSHLPRHHCENNALVANWCNEGTVPEVSCLLLAALDEYVCTCHENPKACPTDCVGGTLPDKKTNHAIRCKGIPSDQPNYVLTG